MKAIEKIKECTKVQFISELHTEFANSVVLVKETATTNKKTGETKFSVSVLPVCEYSENDNNGKIIRNVLNTFVAQYKVDAELSDLYNIVYNDKKAHVTLSFATMLNTTAIYTVDNDGKVTTAVISDIPLNKTALKITENMNILTASNTEKKRVINAQTTLVINQAKYLRNINDVAKGKAMHVESVDAPEQQNITAFGILKSVQNIAK